MPYLRIYCPELAIDLKRQLVIELTEGMIHALELPQKYANWFSIHFHHYKLEDMAIGGQLMLDTQNFEYQIELFAYDLNAEKKRNIVTTLTNVFAKHLNLGPEKLFMINVIIKEYDRSNFAIGGKFIEEYDIHNKP